MRKKILLILFIGFCVCMQSQSKRLNTDSLLGLIPAANDSMRSKLYNTISRSLGGNYPDSAFVFADSALVCAGRSQFERGKAEAYFNLGFTAFNKGKYELCILNFVNSLKIYERFKNNRAISNLNNGLGNV